MKIEKIRPNVITYWLTLDETDEEYHRCICAVYTFDCDNGHLSINSDAGIYSYCWGYSEHQDFMQLMGTLDQEYLLDKISDRSIFNIIKSKDCVIANIERYGMGCFGIKDREQMNRILKEINDIDYDADERTFCREVCDIIPDIDRGSIEIIKEYPHRAVTVASLFTKYLQPEIRKQFCHREKIQFAGIEKEDVYAGNNRLVQK